MKPFQLYAISRYRAELMGLAMIFIILFHVSLPRHAPLYGLVRMGNIGVDIFLFLSGIGLWFSWDGMAERSGPFFRRWFDFYVRRLRRVFPAWFIVASLFYVPRFLERTNHSLASYIDLAGDVLLNWDFWLHDELTFWYIPATMMLYVFAPPYMEAVRRHGVMRWLVVIPLMWCILVQYVTPLHACLGHIEIFWSRVPIFFLGINIAESIRRREVCDGPVVWLALMMLAVSFPSCVWLEQMRHGHFPLFLERMLYIPFAVSLIILASRLLLHAGRYVCSVLSWIGGISLETYLIHAEFVLKPMRSLHLGYWLTAIATALVSFLLAWVLHKAIQRMMPLLRI
ncbi:MAG: acyltransferase family protein [Prevotella sp.]